jgi:hypothetical protein
MAGGLLFALMPGYVLFGCYLWAENVACLLALSAILLTYRGKGAASGGLWGLCALARVSTLAWLPVVGVWSHFAMGRSVRGIAAWGMVCALPIMCYSAWNSVRAGYPVLIADTAGYSLYYGNNPWMEPTAPSTMFRQRKPMQATLASAQGHREYVDRATFLAFRFIRQEPQRFIKRGVRKLGWMWGPYTYPVMRVDLGEYSALRGEVRRKAAMFVLGTAHMLVLVLILTGALMSLKNDYTKFALALMLVTSAGCFAMVGLSRYVYPLLVLGAPLAGWALARVTPSPDSRTPLARTGTAP